MLLHSHGIAAKKLGTIGRSLALVLALGGQPASGCASCGLPGSDPPEPEAPRSDPLPAPDFDEAP